MFGLDRKAAIGAAILLALAIVAALFALQQWRHAQSARTETRLTTSLGNAAIQSGQDASNTVGNRAQADAETDAITRSNHDAIYNAAGADAPVADGVRDAGIGSLCRRAAYSGDPRCVQQPHP